MKIRKTFCLSRAHLLQLLLRDDQICKEILSNPTTFKNLLERMEYSVGPNTDGLEISFKLEREILEPVDELIHIENIVVDDVIVENFNMKCKIKETSNKFYQLEFDESGQIESCEAVVLPDTRNDNE